ncbi:MAG: Uma2 family endonuclease [Alphaproteobacteria bacterium]|nr:Uma2 family endonuclease [Alphaproteobacteria bacterium]
MTTTLTRGGEGLDRRGFSFADIEAMLEADILNPDEKFELIDGEIVPMNAQNMPHMMWKSRINRWFVYHLPKTLVLVPEATLRLIDKPRANTFETDLLIFQPEPEATAIRAPMVRLAIEVADTSITRDAAIKAPRYGKAGVVELWVVDVVERRTIRHRQPGASGYDDIETIDFSDAIAPLFDPSLVLRLADLEDS